MIKSFSALLHGPLKFILLLIILTAGINVYGQKISGIVTDKTTKQALSGAKVSIGNAKTMTDQIGRFEITVSTFADSLKITHAGYQTYAAALNKTTAVLLIELEPKVSQLNEVTIHGTRDFKKDSIANRLDYAKQFNYKGPKLKDIFSTDVKQPGELLSINLLTLVEVLTEKSTPEYNFNKILKRDEHEQYVDEKFNHGIVSRITDLQGDALGQFLTQYRPDYQFALKATDYDMEVYIKGCFEKFKKGVNTETNPFNGKK